MIDHPALFSAPMIRAMLGSRKTQTRRLAWRVTEKHPEPRPTEWQMMHRRFEKALFDFRPNYQERIWVKETFRIADGGPILDAAGGQMDYIDPEIVFAADMPKRVTWTSPLHMPRALSRLTLVVSGTRLEHLQDITHDDAVAEGCYRIKPCPEFPNGNAWGRAGYAALWNSLHGHGAWDMNPEVVAITFAAERRNIDQETPRRPGPEIGE